MAHKMYPDGFFKCNRNGKGFRVSGRFVTTFEERALFLTSSSNYVTDKQSPAELKVATSKSAEAKRNHRPPVCIEKKRKFDENAKDDELKNKVGNSLKRIKTGGNYSNNSNQDETKALLKDSVFDNDLLVRTIFANLKVEDLKSCRPVNSLWNLEATNILLERDCLAAVNITKDTVGIHDTAEYKLPTDLQDFQNMFRNSKLFPSTSFAVINQKLSDDEVNFFREYGYLVKSFCFESGFEREEWYKLDYDEGTSVDAILLAATCFPNLTTLKLIFKAVLLDNLSLITIMALEHIPDFTNLHTLEITPDVPEDIVSIILKKAINLRNIYFLGENFCDSDLIFAMDTLTTFKNVIPRLKNINLISLKNDLDVYEKFLKHNPQFCSIEAIDIDGIESSNLAEVGRCLTALFLQCSESLTEILSASSLEDVPGLNFPVLPNVKRLEIQLPFLPAGVNLAEVFPYLTKLEIVWPDEDKLKKILSEEWSPLLSVRSLQVNWGDMYIPEMWVKKICSWVPNVTVAKFCNPISNSGYEFIWKLSSLRDLHLEIGTKERAKFSELDSAFTGFSVGMAKQLYKIIDTSFFILSVEEIESLRIKPSVVDLKELRKLSLNLFDATIRDEEDYSGDDTFGEKNVNVIFDAGDDKALLKVDGKIILSCLSKRFGFDLCSRLKSNVSVNFTHYTKLDAEAAGSRQRIID